MILLNELRILLYPLPWPRPSLPPLPLDSAHGILGNYTAGGSCGPNSDMVNGLYPRSTQLLIWGFSFEPNMKVCSKSKYARRVKPPDPNAITQ